MHHGQMQAPVFLRTDMLTRGAKDQDCQSKQQYSDSDLGSLHRCFPFWIPYAVVGALLTEAGKADRVILLSENFEIGGGAGFICRFALFPKRTCNLASLSEGCQALFLWQDPAK